jgi:sugar lactone lactonase YvrE
VYVADSHNNAVKEIPSGCASAGCVVTLGSSPAFEAPTGVAVDSVGNVYVADPGNHTVQEIYANCVSINCTVSLGGGFSTPTGVAVDGSENVYVADSSGKVQKMTPYCGSTLCITTLGGSFHSPVSVAVDTSGHVYVDDDGNGSPGHGTVKQMSSGCLTAGCVTTLAQNFSAPLGVAADVNGNIYVGDSGNNAVKQVMPRGANYGSVDVAAAAPPVLTLTFIFDTGGTLASTPYNVLTLGASNLDFNAAATQPSTACVAGHAYSAGGTCTVDVIFTPKLAGQRLGAVLLEGSTSAIATAFLNGTGNAPEVVFLPAKMSVLGGGFTIAYGVAVDGTGKIYVVDSSKKVLDVLLPGCTTASCVKTLITGFTTPSGIAVDGSGIVYIADSSKNTINKIPAGCTAISCMTALGGGFKTPLGITVDATGNVYVADNGNSAVKEIAPGCVAASCVTTLGGGFSVPTGVAVDTNGNIFVADTANNVVKMMTPGCASTSCVKIIGGGFNNPFDVAVSGSGGFVYVADGHGSAIKEMTPGCTTSSCVVTLSVAGTYGFPQSLTVDGRGNLYVADRQKNLVSELDMADVPAALKFATPTMQGATDSTDGAQTITLQNIGTTALTIPILSTGNDPNITRDFTLGASSSGNCPQVSSTSSAAGTLAAGTSCTLAVTFTPITATGSLSGTLVLTDNNLNAPATAYAAQSLSLSGTATPGTPDFTLTNAGSASETVTPGSSVSFTFNVAPVLSQFPGAVSYTVSGLPTGATSTFTPTSISATGAAQFLTLTIQAPAVASVERGDSPFPWDWHVSLAFLLLPLAVVRRKRFRLANLLILSFAVLTGFGIMTGCAGAGGTNPPSGTPSQPLPPAQTYTISVTATSGTKTHTATASLTVE